MMMAQIDTQAVQTAWLREITQTIERDARATVKLLMAEAEERYVLVPHTVVWPFGEPEAT